MPLIPLASADNLSPIPKDVLRGRIEGESSFETWESLDCSGVRTGGQVFPPTNSPISISGFVGRRTGDLEARDVALPGRGGGRREESGSSSEDNDDEDDEDSSSEDEDARDCGRRGCDSCVTFEAAECLEIIDTRIAAASGTSADAETLPRLCE